MWATRPAMTAAMGRAFREKYPVPGDVDLFGPVMVRRACGPAVNDGRFCVLHYMTLHIACERPGMSSVHTSCGADIACKTTIHLQLCQKP